MEEISTLAPRPLISWGILIACLGAMQDNFGEVKDRLGLGKKFRVGIDFPYEEQIFPCIVMTIDGLQVRNSGFYSAELTEPRNEVLMSYGSIGIEIFSENHNQLMTLVDYISRCYLLNMFNRQQMFFPGMNRDYVAIGYAGGSLDWSRFDLVSQDWTDQNVKRLYHTTTSFEFKAEHHMSTDLAKISAIDIEAIPLNLNI